MSTNRQESYVKLLNDAFEQKNREAVELQFQSLIRLGAEAFTDPALTPELKAHLIDRFNRSPDVTPEILKILLKGTPLSRRTLRTWIHQSNEHPEKKSIFQEEYQKLIGNKALPKEQSALNIKHHDDPVERQKIFDEIILPDAGAFFRGDKQSPLYWAAFLGLAHELPAELPPVGSDNRDVELKAAFEGACQNGHVNAALYLLDQNCIQNFNDALVLAIQSGHRPLVDAFLKYGAEKKELFSEANRDATMKFVLWKNSAVFFSAIVDYCLENKVIGIDWLEILKNVANKSEHVETIVKLLASLNEIFTPEVKANLIKELDLNRMAPRLIGVLLHETKIERLTLRTLIHKTGDAASKGYLRAAYNLVIKKMGSKAPEGATYANLEELARVPSVNKQDLFDHVVLPIAGVNIRGIQTPFYWAAYLGLAHELPNELPPQGTPERQNILSAALIAACENGHTKVVEYLTDPAGLGLTNAMIDKALLKVCQSKRTDIVDNLAAIARLLIQAGADVNRYESGLTPLMRACEGGNKALVLVLLAENANPRLLSHAVENKRGEQSRQELRLDDQFMAIHIAAQHGHLDLVNVFDEVSRGEPNQTPLRNTPLSVAIEYGQKEVYEELLRQDDPDPEGIAFLTACECNNYEVMIQLLKKNNKVPDCYEYTPPKDESVYKELEMLLEKAETRDEIVYPANAEVAPLAKAAFIAACLRTEGFRAKRLLRQFPELQQQRKAILEEALESASKNGNARAVALILELQPASEYELNQLMFYACRNNHIELAKLLLGKGAAINQVFPILNCTALFIACASEHTKLVSILVEHNPDFSITNAEGVTITHMVTMRHGAEILKSVFQNPNYSKATRNQLLISVCESLGKLKRESDTESYVVDNVKTAIQYLFEGGVDDDTKAQAREIVNRIPHISKIAALFAPDPKAHVGVSTVNKTSTTVDQEQPKGVPASYHEAEKYIQFLGKVANRVKHSFLSGLPRGKEKSRQLQVVIDGLTKALNDNPNLTKKDLFRLGIVDTKTNKEITAESALQYRRFLPYSRGLTRSAIQVARETDPAQLKAAVKKFIETEIRRLKNDKSGQGDALRGLNLEQLNYDSIEALCASKSENEETFLHLLAWSNQPKPAFKRFEQEFHLHDHLTDQEISNDLNNN